jgi:hypothetical protein
VTPARSVAGNTPSSIRPSTVHSQRNPSTSGERCRLTAALIRITGPPDRFLTNCPGLKSFMDTLETCRRFLSCHERSNPACRRCRMGATMAICKVLETDGPHGTGSAARRAAAVRGTGNVRPARCRGTAWCGRRWHGTMRRLADARHPVPRVRIGLAPGFPGCVSPGRRPPCGLAARRRVRRGGFRWQGLSPPAAILAQWRERHRGWSRPTGSGGRQPVLRATGSWSWNLGHMAADDG